MTAADSTARTLAGQTAWITGSSRGLGRVMAEELARLGARVAVHGSRPDSPTTFGEGTTMDQLSNDIARGCDADVMAVHGDVTCEADVARNVAEIRQRWGRIDILVCCAGGDIGAGGTG
ncbi:MAG: SDR family NAD(P)-dependent oxidoreductase, partial [Planctomycetaceae bacterium]|nr:SDR family NAD(P)-dependent oxidoreductase [Planctomycetaceae bacterium]